MAMTKYILTLLALACILSCKKKDSNTPTVKPINFHGIISTDNNGNIIYNNDSTDWKQNDNWSATEAGLFPSSKPICSNRVNHEIFCYPNPCNGYATIHYLQSTSICLAYRIVDRNYNILMANDSLKSLNIILDLSKYKGGDTLRMYYKIINTDCECRGHGDIVVQ